MFLDALRFSIASYTMHKVIIGHSATAKALGTCRVFLNFSAGVKKGHVACCLIAKHSQFSERSNRQGDSAYGRG